MAKHVGNVALDPKDPRFFLQYLNLNNINRISDMNIKNRDDRNNLMIFVFSIILGIAASIFVNIEIWWMVLILTDLLLIILIWKIHGYNNDRKLLRNMIKPLIKTSEGLGLPLPGTEEFR